MVGRVTLKIWLEFAAVLLFFAIWIDVLLRWRPPHQTVLQSVDSTWLRIDLALAFLFTLPVAGLVSLLISRRTRQNQRVIKEFARKLAAGDYSARVYADDIAGAHRSAESLNDAALSLGRMHRALDTSRRELAALLDSMEEAVIAISPEGQVSWSNAVLEKISQYPVRLGQALVHSVRDPDVLSCVEQALRLREACKGRATTVAAGRVFQVSVAPTPGGGAVVVLHDVTKIEQAEVSRRDFVANVSHELRTPLTSISGYVETLIESHCLPEEQVKEFLAIILKNATRMNRLTEDLLALARVESKDYALTPQESRASDLLVDAIESLAPLATEAGMRLIRGDTTDDLVRADPDAMQQVFGNLIENAVKYGRQGGRIVVGCRRIGENVEFTVKDFGPGIASHHLSRIFERFYRVDTARSRESGGTGLGLAIVKRVLEAHGGDVWVESELGQGTSFQFRLPALGGVVASAQGVPEVPESTSSTLPARPLNPSVLTSDRSM
jgi:two-component system phosphate regulon sensor histidine kinase PhoR